MAKPGTRPAEPAVRQPPVRTEQDAARGQFVLELVQRRRHQAAAEREAQVAQARVEQPVVRPACPAGGAARWFFFLRAEAMSLSLIMKTYFVVLHVYY